MTQEEKLKIKFPEATANEIALLLDDSKNVILNRRFPFAKTLPDTIEDKYLSLQIAIAVELYNKDGAEGEMSHSEGDVSRTYANAYVSEDLLSQIIPMGDLI